MCVLETSPKRRPKPDMDCSATENKCDVSGNKLTLNPSNLPVIENKRTEKTFLFFRTFWQNRIINSMAYGCYFLNSKRVNQRILKVLRSSEINFLFHTKPSSLIIVSQHYPIHISSLISPKNNCRDSLFIVVTRLYFGHLRYICPISSKVRGARWRSG